MLSTSILIVLRTPTIGLSPKVSMSLTATVNVTSASTTICYDRLAAHSTLNIPKATAKNCLRHRGNVAQNVAVVEVESRCPRQPELMDMSGVLDDQVETRARPPGHHACHREPANPSQGAGCTAMQ